MSWVSANTWANGSIYGNVRFEFDWKELVEGKQFYWVEGMKAYKPPAFRILVSDSSPSGLEEYDVEDKQGPLYYDSESQIWYRNGELTSEFLFDSNLPLTECTSVVFDSHHRSYCRKYGNQCAYLNKTDAEAGAELIARLVAHGHKKYLNLFLDADSKSKA